MGMRRVLWLLATVGLGAVFVLGVGTYFSRTSVANTLPVAEAQVVGTVQTPQGEMPHAVLELSSWPDSLGGCHGEDGGEHPNWVTFCPTTELSLPAHALVTIKIAQHDGGEVITNPYFAEVHGTVDGTATLNGETFNAIPPDKVGHTFTLHGVNSPSQDDLFVSVPLMAANEENVGADGYPVPNMVEFSFYTSGPGTYFWNCEFPCGDGTYANFGGPMSAQGYMAGRITVK
jgi:hypothetical protein